MSERLPGTVSAEYSAEYTVAIPPYDHPVVTAVLAATRRHLARPATLGFPGRMTETHHAGVGTLDERQRSAGARVALAELNPADRRIAAMGPTALAGTGLEAWAAQFTQEKGEQS